MTGKPFTVTAADYGRPMRLIGRRGEQEAVTELLDSVRVGMSRTLVICGEPGIGKSLLLDHAVECASDMHTVRMVGVDSERALAFAGVHQLLLPFLPMAVRLPGPQRQALGIAFGEIAGPPADSFLVGLAVLSLLSLAAESRPVLCVVDDAQWLDEESVTILGFVARRLLADRVGMLFGVRAATTTDLRLPALPAIRLRGLANEDARELLEDTLGQAIDRGVAERIATAVGGNPLALIEAARELTADQRAGLEALPEPLPIGAQLEESFARRVQELPADTRMLLVLAAADQPGRADRLWRAAASVGIGESAAEPAETAGVAAFWPEARFSHPLVRSAVYYSATAMQRRQAHSALADASDTDRDLDSRAWHRAAAASGPDEEAASELQAAAERARSRGGYAAAASLMTQAAMLTGDAHHRAERRLSAAEAHFLAGAIDRADSLLAEAAPALGDPLARAQATRLKGRVEFTRGRVAEAAAVLVSAAQRLSPLDPDAARDALLSALEAAVFDGWTPGSPLLEQIADVARNLPPTRDPPDSAPNLLLRGFISRITDGYQGAVVEWRRSVHAFLGDGVDPDVALQRLEPATIAAADLLDDDAVEQLTNRWAELARGRGALAKLAAALAFRGAFVDAPAGRLASARAAEAEARELAEATRNLAVVPPTGAHTLLTLVLSGREAEARATAAAVARDAPQRGAAGETALAAYALGILELSLGNYAAAVECLQSPYEEDTPLVGTRVLPELVEAGLRADHPDLARAALARFAERARSTGTPLALGLLARSQALLADPPQAREHFEEAVDLLGRTRRAPQLARAHLLYGEWLRRQRRRREARDQLRTAHDLFDQMGLEAFARRAGLELRATGEHARRREPGHPEGLTPQEMRIAQLVSQGEANRDIASQLFISPSTVEYHLHKVFRKLDVTSRTQLAHRMVQERAGVLQSI